MNQYDRLWGTSMRYYYLALHVYGSYMQRRLIDKYKYIREYVHRWIIDHRIMMQLYIVLAVYAQAAQNVD
jgi:hypothetical protein